MTAVTGLTWAGYRELFLENLKIIELKNFEEYLDHDTENYFLFDRTTIYTKVGTNLIVKNKYDLFKTKYII